MYSVSLWRSICSLLTVVFLSLPAVAPAVQATVIDLAEAQARALAYSPNLAAGDLGLKAAAARRDQAGRRPNPGLEMEWENFAGSGDLTGIESSEWTVSVSQIFDLSGKRGLMKDQISNEISLLDWEQKSTLLDLQQNVGLDFADVWFAQGTVALVHEQKELAIMLQTELTERLKAGGSSAIEVTRARLHVAAAEVSLIHAEENLRTAINNLTSLWGSNNPDFQVVSLPPGFWDHSGLAPADINVNDNPDVTRWNSVLSLQSARLLVVEAANSVDLELALGMKYENFSGDRAFVFGAAIPLPTSDRNQDEVRAIGYKLKQVEKLKQESLNSLEAQLAAAVGSQTSARREMDIMSAEIIPLALQAYEETRIAHQQGLFSLTDVIATRNDLFELRQTQLQSQFNFFTASVMISRLTGKDALEIAPHLLEKK